MRTVLAWSSGKDAAWALHRLRADPAFEVVGLLTTLNRAARRVAMHGVRQELLEQQAAAVGLPLYPVPLPSPCDDAQYEAIMREVVQRLRADGIGAMAFGDLFLEDVRRYRERTLASTGITPVFPLWGIPTSSLAREMVAAGSRGIVTCVDPRRLDRAFAGRTFDAGFLDDLPPGVDPCGENGEYHTFAYAGPMFEAPLPLEGGPIVERGGFIFADLRLAGSPRDPIPGWIPEDVRGDLDLSELEQEDEAALAARDQLERELGAHVAVYRRGSRGRPRGLCERYASASLSSEQVAQLVAAEARLPRHVLVAYASPLRAR